MVLLSPFWSCFHPFGFVITLLVLFSSFWSCFHPFCFIFILLVLFSPFWFHLYFCFYPFDLFSHFFLLSPFWFLFTLLVYFHTFGFIFILLVSFHTFGFILTLVMLLSLLTCCPTLSSFYAITWTYVDIISVAIIIIVGFISCVCEYIFINIICYIQCFSIIITVKTYFYCLLYFILIFR